MTIFEKVDYMELKPALDICVNAQRAKANLD